MFRTLNATIAACCIALPALAGSVEPRDGWAVHDTDLSYAELLDHVKSAVKAGGMVVVTEAGPTEAAASRGIDIPGNRVIGVFHNNYAVQVLRASVPAMIEAPIRMYVTEDDDGTATLSYKKPSFVFEPYMNEGGEELKEAATKLDEIFAEIATIAIK
jgi:uncharacterized protein (DUF302 family)